MVDMAPDLETTLRDAAKASGLSLYALSKRSGLRVSVVQQFMTGGDIRLRTASKLCAVLGLDLLPKRRRKPKAGE